nr:alpha/beta hydrolase [Palleronia pontilimi]
MFLHCSLASHRAWMPVIKLLHDDLDMTAFDLPGHGRSGDWTEDDGDIHGLSARIAASFCDGPTDIVGHSFGAAVGLRLAVERPDLVRRMVLVEPVFFAAARGTGAHARHREQFEPVTDALARGDREQATRVFSNMWGGARDFDDLPTAQRRAMIDRIHLIAASSPGIEGDSGDLMADGRLAATHVPTLLVSGTGSAPIIHAIHDSLRTRMPQAATQRIDGAGHMAPLTHPETVADLIRAHLLD